MGSTKLINMNIEKLASKVCVLAKITGKFILEESVKLSSSDIRDKDKNSFVTYIDIEAEKRIVKGLNDMLPGSSFITEEKTTKEHSAEYTWIVDPLDGTTNYIHGIPVYSISIALQRNKHTILGVVYEINRKECFYAYEGSGAFMNDRTIKVSDSDKLSDSLLATGFPYYDYSLLPNYISLFSECMKRSRGIRRLGSAAVDLAYVACGRFEGFFEYGLNAWDVAAGAFILERAGGKVSNFSDGPDFIRAKEIVATNARIHDEFISLLKEHFA